MSLTTAHQTYSDKVKARFGRMSPFRLGMVVARAGDSLPSPYGDKTAAHKLYEDGLRAGREMRERQMTLALTDKEEGREFS